MKLEYKCFNDSSLPDILNEFLNYLLSIRGKSNNTVDGYKFDLEMFLRFMKLYKVSSTNTENFEDIKINDIDVKFIKSIKLSDMYAFLSFAEKYRNNGDYARARKVAALRSFFKYLFSKAKVINENPAAELESPKLSKRNPVYLTLNESRRLLEAIDGRNKERDYCIITLFLNCGMRLSELCSINISKIKNDTLSIVGKGNKERTIYLNETALRSIDDYLYVRSRIDDIPEEFKDALFISGKKRRINKRTVELIVKKYIYKAGLDSQKYSPHKLRHTAATLMYKYGNVDIRSLQSILGHESISTTQIYTHVDDERLRKAVKSNPLNDIDNDNEEK